MTPASPGENIASNANQFLGEEVDQQLSGVTRPENCGRRIWMTDPVGPTLQSLKYQLNVPARLVPLQDLRRRYMVTSREHDYVLGDFQRRWLGAPLLLTSPAAQPPMTCSIACSFSTPHTPGL